MIVNHAIRLATLDDAPRIGAMSRDLIEQGLGWRWTPSSIRQCIRSPSTNVAVAPSTHGIAGFAVMQYKDDEAHLILLGVDPAQRRHGIASALMAWHETAALSNRAARCASDVFPQSILFPFGSSADVPRRQDWTP
jgi:ribosomal protein S18 acetylase RimI-like enzyme